jgi:hypothetical protein
LWLKRATTTPPLAQHGGGRWRVGCMLCSPEDLPLKNVSCAYIIIKSTLKITFFFITPDTKKLGKIFFKNVMPKASWTYFYIKKRLF